MNLKAIRKAKGYTQAELAKIVGVAQNTLSYWERGETKIDSGTLSKLSTVLGVSVDHILGKEPEPIAQPIKNKGIRIPVLGKIQAGIPIEAIQDVLDWEEIPEDWVKHGEEYIALQIRGNSMAPKLLEGDVVILRRQDDVESGDIAAVLVNGNDATIKKVKKNLTGITLIPFNTGDYDPLTYSNQQIQDLPVKIIGRLVELRRKF